jgi:N-acetylmuramic acid 6-phosphate etherase
MSTEARNPRSIGLDKMSAAEIVRLMNEEERIVFKAMEDAEPAIAEAIEAASAAWLAGGRIIYIGAGTSGRIATMDAAEMPPTFGVPADRFVALMAGGQDAGGRAVENAEDEEAEAVHALNALGVNQNDLVIGLAASGRTPYVLGGLRHASQKGIKTVGISNNRGAALLEESDIPILLATGPEVLTGSTRLKAGTAQKLVLNRISTGAMVLSGKVVENLMVDVVATNQKLRERCVRIVCELTTATEDEARSVLAANGYVIRAAVAKLS